MSGYIYLLKLTQNQQLMRKNKRKQSVVNSENVMTAVHVACACAAVASVLVPAVRHSEALVLSVPRLFRLG